MCSSAHVNTVSINAQSNELYSKVFTYTLAIDCTCLECSRSAQQRSFF